MTEAELETLIEAVKNSLKYRRIGVDFIRRIGEKELRRQPNFKAAVKATKNKLHQTTGAYLNQRVDYDRWLVELQQTRNDAAQWRATCERLMRAHASTAERLSILPEFYATLLANLPPIHTIIDVACGLNPLALGWMPLAEGFRYLGYDIYEDMVDFLNAFFVIAQVGGRAQVADAGQFVPAQEVDLALILKTLPCLEQTNPLSGRWLLENIHAKTMIVSFPAHSLGGKNKGMPANYDAHFRELIAGLEWSAQQFDFATEIAYVLTRA